MVKHNQKLAEIIFKKLKPVDYFYENREKDSGHTISFEKACKAATEKQLVYSGKNDCIVYGHYDQYSHEPPYITVVAPSTSASNGQTFAVGRVVNSYFYSGIKKFF